MSLHLVPNLLNQHTFKKSVVGVIANIELIFVQLDFFLGMLGQEKKGCPFLQMKQPLRFSSFLPTSSVNFLKILLQCLATPGKCVWTLYVYVTKTLRGSRQFIVGIHISKYYHFCLLKYMHSQTCVA